MCNIQMRGRSRGCDWCRKSEFFTAADSSRGHSSGGGFARDQAEAKTYMR